MSRLGLLGLLGTVLAVLVLLGSMIGGLLPERSGPAPGGDAPVDPGAVHERVRVEVLNAAGISGLARAATEKIRAAGFDVVYYGNASSFGRDTSAVLDRSGQIEAAHAVAEAIDIPLVLQRPDTTLYLDVTVIIGRDWAGAPAPADTAPR